MRRNPERRAAVPARLAFCAVVLLAGAASAQPLPAPRSEREPNPAEVLREERAAGVAPGAAEQRREGQAVDQIYRELTGPNARAGVAPPPAPPISPAQEAQTENQLFRELTGQNPGAPAAPR